MVISRNPSPVLKRKAALAQMMDELERNESARVAKHVSIVPGLSMSR